MARTTLGLPSQSGQNGKYLKTNGTVATWEIVTENGDVAGPASSTNNNVAVFDGLTGKVIKDGGATLASKQDALGFTPENIANKKTTLADNSDTYYPTQKAVKTAVDAKQATLVSGTNIKTINSTSLLGSGDIAITVPVKATGAEADTGSDDDKFLTAKAAKDSHNIPSVAPGTSGNVLTSNGTDWTSAAPSGGGGNKSFFLSAETAGISGTGVTKGGVLYPFQQGVAMTDNNDNQRAIVTFTTPSDFTSITSVEAYWATPATSGNGYFTFISAAMGANEVYNSVTQDSIANAAYAANGTQLALTITDVTAMINGLTLSAGDLVTLVFERDGADANDTLSNTVYFFGFRVVYS